MERYVVVITMHADPAMAPGYDEWGGTVDCQVKCNTF